MDELKMTDQKTRKYDAVVFDLDGTLLDTLADLTASTNFALMEMGYPDRSIDEVRSFVGNGIADLIRRSVPCGTSEADTEKTLAIFRGHYAEHSADRTAPYEGILPLLDTLKAQGYGIAVVSNKIDPAVRVLCRQYFGDRIDAAAGERQGVSRKPSPDSVFYVLREIDCQRDRAVYVGDSDVDILTASNAGMDHIGVSWGFRDKSFLLTHGASGIADSPMDILKFLV